MTTTAPSQDFMSVDHLKAIMDIFKGFLKDRYALDTEEMPVDVKKMIYQSMKHVSEQPDSTNMTMRDLYLLTLRHARANISQVIQNQPQILTKRATQTQPLKRDAAVFGSRPIASDHLLPEIHNRREMNDLTMSMELLKKERDPGQPKESTPVMESSETIAAIPASEFQSRLDEIQKERTQTAVATILPSTMKPTPLPFLSQEGTESEPQMLNGGGGVEDEKQEKSNNNLGIFSDQDTHRDMAIKDILREQKESDPLAMYKMVQDESWKQRDIITKRENPATSSKLSMYVEPPNSKQIIQKKYILIDSLNRDWVAQNQRYRYKVKFNKTSQYIKKDPFYENNPTIPFTKTVSSTGVPNISGWYDEAGAFHPAYNPSLPAGNILGYEEIPTPIDNDANIQTNFKNIVSLQVTNVIMPMDIVLMNTPTNNLKSIFNFNFNLNFPYILLHISEFGDVYEGTDDTIRKSFCQLVYKKSYQSSNGRGYIVMRPVQCEKKVFYPTPLSTLPSLSFSFLKPNGELVNNSRDGQTIMKLEFEPFNNQYLKIVLNKYFDKNEYFKGDTIQIRNFTLYKLVSTQNQAAINRINDYMNQVQGHEVTQIGEANDNGFYRTFYIRAPGIFNELSGKYDLDEEGLQQIILFNQVYDYSTNPENGFVLNMSLQNCISLTVEQKVYDSVIPTQTI